MTTPWYDIAERDLGVSEIPGPVAHERILELADKAGIDWYKSDETAWCAVAANGWLVEAGYKSTESAMARSFERSKHFRRVEKPYKGCIVTFWRKSKTSGFGHVGLYAGETAASIKVLGGNQSNSVSIANYNKKRLTGYWEPVGYRRDETDENEPEVDTATLTDHDIAVAALDLGCDPAMIAAIWEVEAGGNGFFSDGRLKILCEKHVFYKQIAKGRRQQAVKEGLATPKWTRDYSDQKTSSARYNLAMRMRAFDETAAYNSVSMGGPQIMGFNATKAGYETAREMFTAFSRSEREQLKGLLHFARSAGLTRAMQQRDFVAFTRGYNGSGQVAAYSKRLETAYKKHAKKTWPPVVSESPSDEPPPSAPPPVDTPPADPPVNKKKPPPQQSDNGINLVAIGLVVVVVGLGLAWLFGIFN